MDPSDKKWLKVYIGELKQKIHLNVQNLNGILLRYNSVYNFVHFYIHTSGLFYGYVSKQLLTDFKNSNTWNYADKYKIAYVEGFFITFLFKNKHKIKTEKQLQSLIEDASDKIYDFFLLLSISDSFFKKNKNLLATNNEDYITLEKIIDNRIDNTSMLKKGFWKGSQFNVFAYLDILFFAHWLDKTYLYDKKNEITFSILQTMIAASYSEGNIIKVEKGLVSYFLAAANFDKISEQKLEKYIEKGIYLSAIKYDSLLPYDIRLIIFENAVVSVLSDTRLNNFEELFLGRLSEKLEITEEDAQYSMVLIQNFFVQNNKHILYLHHKDGIEAVTKSFINRFQNFFYKNSSKIILEMSESKELLELLWKAKNEKLTDEEREKVKEQIIDLLKTIPSLTIFMIPGGSILLPILLKILPEDLIMPSSFRNK